MLFSPPVASGIVSIGRVGPFASIGSLAYLGSTLLVATALLRNLDQPWFPLIALGAALNLIAIAANGGVMPADPAALAAVGLLDRAGGALTNTAPVSGAWFSPLGDNWTTPTWLPFANVVSVGDLLIGLGAAGWLTSVMRGGRAMRTAGGIRPLPSTSR